MVCHGGFAHGSSNGESQQVSPREQKKAPQWIGPPIIRIKQQTVQDVST